MSPESFGSRDFDNPDRYEREKATRVMPRDIKERGLYTWRLRVASGNPYAIEYLTAIVKSEEQVNGEFQVEFIFYPDTNSKEAGVAETTLSENGYTIVKTPQGEVIEIGYFVGSTDPYDIGLAELIQKAQEFAPV